MLCQGKKIDGIVSTVYLDNIDEQSIDNLIKYRKKANISSQNEYLYALPSNVEAEIMRHADAHKAIIKLVKNCQEMYHQLEEPEKIRATRNRAFIATTFGSVGDDRQKENITNHLGHTTKVNDSFYKKTIPENDIFVTTFLEKRFNKISNHSTLNGKLQNVIHYMRN